MPETWSRRSVLQAATAAWASRTAAQEAPGTSERPRLPRPVRVGIIGLDGHYSEVLEAAKFLSDIQVVAVAASSPREISRFTGNRVLAAARRYDDYRQLLDSEKLEAVALCDANHQRAASLIACAERGLAIAAEKPLVLTLEELDAVKKSVARHGTRLTMLLPMRFEPPFLAMKAIVSGGQIGEPAALAAQKSYQLGLRRGLRPEWMKSRRSYGGTIPFIGIHMVDLMRWIGGREFVETAAFQSTVGFPEIGEMENNAAVIYRMDNRGTASLRLDYLRPEAASSHGDDRLRIAGTRGVVEYRAGEVTLITAEAGLRVVQVRPRHPPLFADFLLSLDGDRKHLIAVDDVFRVTELVLRSREAAESGRVVRC